MNDKFMHDVPEAISCKIIAAANRQSKAIRFRRSLKHVVFTSATAAALLVGSALFFLPEIGHDQLAKPTKSISRELTMLNDWSALEQESYFLSVELFSGSQVINESSHLPALEEL
ncbi:MAG: hypothetical protein LBM70_04105 [Victivallales bacterium]|jgi:hypothetical protein|nr:hypothetical protein [Victivallales bacterium]